MTKKENFASDCKNKMHAVVDDARQISEHVTKIYDKLQECKNGLISSRELQDMLAPLYKPNTTKHYLRVGRFPFNPIKIGGRLYVDRKEATRYALQLATIAIEGKKDDVQQIVVEYSTNVAKSMIND